METTYWNRVIFAHDATRSQCLALGSSAVGILDENIEKIGHRSIGIWREALSLGAGYGRLRAAICSPSMEADYFSPGSLDAGN